MKRELIQRYAASPVAFLEDLIIPTATGPVRFGDVMRPEQRERFEAMAPSFLALAKGEPPPVGRFWVECSKGWSKTSDIAALILWLAAFSSRPIRSAQIGASDQDQAAEGRRAAAELLNANRWLADRVQIQNWKITCSATGFEAEIVAAEISGSHGGRPLLLWVDELHAVTKSEFLFNLLDNADKIDGVVILSTNAGFVGTDCYRLREIARTTPRWRFLQIASPPPWVSQAKLDEAKRRNSNSRYLRLWWGIWSSSGDALDSDDIDACTDESLQPMLARERGYGFVAGLDLGLKRDHAGLVVLGRRNDSNLIRVAQVRFWVPPGNGRSIDVGEIESAILELHRLFKFQRLNVDPWQAAYLSQRLLKAQVPVNEVPFVGKNLDAMASELMTVFRERRIRLFPGRLVSDVRKLCIEEKSFGYKLTAARDQDGHADCATSLALGLIGLKDMPLSSGDPWGGVIAQRASSSSLPNVISRPDNRPGPITPFTTF